MTTRPEPDFDEGPGDGGDAAGSQTPPGQPTGVTGPFVDESDTAFGPNGLRERARDEPSPAHDVGGRQDASAEAEPLVGDAGASAGEPHDGTILTDVRALAAERDEYLLAVQRLQADFENYRKRVARQQQEQAARAAADLATKLLPVLDVLDLAADHIDKTAGGAPRSVEAQALLQARTLLSDVLAKEGLERVDQTGVPFDPVIHDAVAHAPAEEPGSEGGTTAPGANGGPDQVSVEEVLRAGYRWRGQVLRPAMVKVRG